MGVSNTGPGEYVSVSELIQMADAAMYLAKKTPGNKLIPYSSLENA